jgi:hypothetical protein
LSRLTAMFQSCALFRADAVDILVGLRVVESSSQSGL